MSKKNNETKPEKSGGSADETSKLQKQDAEQRRGFLKTAVGCGIGMCAVGAPVCAAVRLVTAPVFAESAAGKFYTVAALDTLSDKPQKFFITDDKEDAWMKMPNQKIGSLFLRRSGDEVQAFHSLCPHAGCMIQCGVKKRPQTDSEELLFYCPCHAAHFGLDGKRLDGVSPRDMDTLETKVENGKVSVKFQNFTFGTAKK
ncbi:MAG: Rieske (2Fe-2S) protein [Planctomycetaceae bacterium]|jgi:nitrite reductase/ring-hydroxylating ferredoxin subunit|nr:Rieske (2Fe-2S) protein [Planctomycetaceae bacterium]